MKRKSRCLAICLAAGLWSWPAGATSLQTISWATWNTAAYTSSSPIELNFNGITSNEPQSVTLNPLTGNTSLQFVFTGSTNLTGVSHPSIGLAAPSITITMPSGGENAFWLGLGTYQDSGSLTLALTLSDGETFSPATTSCCSGFGTFSSGALGLSLSQSIKSLTLTAPSGDVVVDDFFFAQSALQQDSGGTPSPAPEAASILLVSGGALILIGARRRIRREA